METVKVVADTNGNVVTVSPNNPEYGWIIVEQSVVQLEGNWMKKSTRSTRINGKVSDLIEAKFTAEQQIPGKIIILESLVPFDTENPDRDLKIAGKSGVICRYDDQPIYRQTHFTTNPNTFDELISHTNREEIREVILAQKMLSELPAEEPTL
jgi:hypothetical protein